MNRKTGTVSGDLAGELGFTAFFATRGEGTGFHWGDISRPVNVNSIRKSLLAALFGPPVGADRAALETRLDELDIDDPVPDPDNGYDSSGLSHGERQARLIDLMTSRSGITHRAVQETADMRAKRPARFAHAPGSFWYYNNWDFNTLGTIYERVAGIDPLAAFARDIAGPIGMQDFAVTDCRIVRGPESAFPAHMFSLSARDLARFGRLCASDGFWPGRGQILPAGWMAECGRQRTATDVGRLGYGLLWWTAPLTANLYGAGTLLALGINGQCLAVQPETGLVAAMVAEPAGTGGPGLAESTRLLRQIFQELRD